MSNANITNAQYGFRAINPYISGSSTSTAYIADLQGGADIYGLLKNVDTSAFVNAAPKDAFAAVIRLDVGPTSDYDDDYAGYDVLLFVNLTDTTLASPQLGVSVAGGNTNYLTSLRAGGAASSTVFGGSGVAQVIQGLGATRSGPLWCPMQA